MDGLAVGGLIILAIVFAIGVAVAKESADKAIEQRVLQKEREIRFEQEQRENSIRRYQSERDEEFRTLVAGAKEFAEQLRDSMLKGREWLANAFAEYIDTRTLDVETWLAAKPHPGLKAVEAVRDVRQALRDAVRELKLLQYQVASYEEYFPFLVEYREAILDESIDLREFAIESLDAADPALSRGYLSREEYDRLPTTEKFQRALDKYWARDKNQWHIGRVYERFVGYLYELDGWQVTYQGILRGYEDFGRDLVCVKGSDVHIVQCKC